MRPFHILTIMLGMITAAIPAQAEFGKEDASSDAGVTNSSDSSWRAYREEMARFPERLGIICYNAYILNKTPDHQEAMAFFKECADRGNAATRLRGKPGCEKLPKPATRMPRRSSIRDSTEQGIEVLEGRTHRDWSKPLEFTRELS